MADDRGRSAGWRRGSSILSTRGSRRSGRLVAWPMTPARSRRSSPTPRTGPGCSTSPARSAASTPRGSTVAELAAADPRQRARLGRRCWPRPDVDRTPGRRRVVAAGVRLPRPRRAPALRRAGRADARRGRPDVRELGPGRDRGRARATTSRTPPPSASSWSSAAGGGRRQSTPPSPATSGRAAAGAATAAMFTVETTRRYHLHDVVHHLHDVGLGRQPTAGRRGRRA